MDNGGKETAIAEGVLRELARKDLLADWESTAELFAGCGQIGEKKDQKGCWNGRQYYEKRLSVPVLVFAKAEGGRAKLYAVNDRPCPVSGELYWALYENNRRVARDLKEITLPPRGAAVYDEVDVPGKDVLNRSVLCYGFWQEYDCLSEGSLLFVEQKDYAFEPALVYIEYFGAGDEYRIELKSHVYVKGVCLDLEEGDAVFSDNFFDLEPGMRKVVSIRKDEVTGVADLGDLKRQLTMVCVNQIVTELNERASIGCCAAEEGS